MRLQKPILLCSVLIREEERCAVLKSAYAWRKAGIRGRADVDRVFFSHVHSFSFKLPKCPTISNCGGNFAKNEKRFAL